MKTILIILTIATVLFAGDNERIPESKALHVQMIAIGAYNSLGFSNMLESPVGQITAGNPAALAEIENFSVGINFNHPSTIKLYSDINLNWCRSYLPASFTVVYPLSDFRFGLGFYRKYAHFIDYGKMEIFTEEQPDGTGEFIENTDETAIFNISAPVSYSIAGLFNREDHISVGLQLSADFVYGRRKIWKTKWTVDERKMNWKAGLVYWFNHRIGLSLLYANETDVTGKVKTQDHLLQFYDIEDGEIFEAEPIKLRYQLPRVFALGLMSKPMNDLSFSVTMSSILWHAMQKYYKNTLDLSVNAIYSLFPFLDISLGVYRTDKMYKDEFYSYISNAAFFSAGARLRLSQFNLHFVVSDSRWYSAKYRKQIQINVGADYEFK